ncbi:uncharacterized protein K02A2.6-like [Stomoxys calcitrans]|uniref:uncharacterized protein K02A2.6-like n=1 Tax=Stomoxys calcitrans TaxID=35570 RepID=UPI0027E360F7|nr:uncharacterized protein K02A2.6-like [Stomoxys calcitrans]
MANGWPEKQSEVEPQVLPFFKKKDSLSYVDECLLFNARVVFPRIYRKKILKQLHRGHFAIEKCKTLARSYVSWPNIDKDIEDWVKICQNCQLVVKNAVKTDLSSWPLMTRPLERVHIDYAGPVKGHYYLIIVDAFSKNTEIYQTSNITATSTIKLMNEYCSHFGNPEQLVLDNGTQFCSSVFEQWCNERAITHTRTVRFHPSSNGQAERTLDTCGVDDSSADASPAAAVEVLFEFRASPMARTLNPVQLDYPPTQGLSGPI